MIPATLREHDERERVDEMLRGETLELERRLELCHSNVDLGKKIIRESGLNVIPADDLDDAASKIVKAVKEAA